MTTLELKPFAVTPNAGDLNWPTYEPIVSVGGGSLTDDSDASYLQVGAWFDSSASGDHWIERFACDFTTPAGFDPTALALRMRVRNSSDVLIDPPQLAAATSFFSVADTASGTLINNASLAAGPMAPLADATVTSPTWVDWYWDIPDPNNPTDAGNWLELALYPAAKQSLTGSGLRAAFAWYSDEATPSRRAWLDVFEFRLLVAGDFVTPTATHVPPLRQWPRSDGLGMSSVRRLWPPPRSVQRSLRQGPGAYL